MRHIKMKYGFTLIELLVVVIIIAVLSAVALPMYKHAALKSRFSKVMPVAKSIVEAQEVYYLGKNIYAANDEKDLLDVSPSGDTTIELAPREQESQYNYVAASSTEVPGARYIVYQKYSPKFADTIQCEADENNPEAVWLCSKGLNGQFINGSVNTAQGSYVTYLLSGTKGDDRLPTSIDKVVARICAGYDEAHCIVSENTVTTLDCQESTGNDDSLTRECINRTYDMDGEPTDYERSVKTCSEDVSYRVYAGQGKSVHLTDESGLSGCKTSFYDEENQELSGKTVVVVCGIGHDTSVSDGSREGEQCVPTKVSNYRSFIKDNFAYLLNQCTKFVDGNCEKYTAITYDPDDKKYNTFQFRVCVGAPKEDGNCAAYAQGEGYDQMSFVQGEQGGLRHCNEINSAGVCTSYKDGWYYVYKEGTNGNMIKTGETTVTQKDGYVEVTYSRWDDSSLSYTKRACDSFDWSTGVCNKWTQE